VRGEIIGIKEFPGAKNLPTSSFVLYLNFDPNLNDPSNKEEARNYITGLDRNGNAPDPCTFPYGEVKGGVDCTTVDPKFWFSGDPVTDVGWIATFNEDVRQMTNTGPFKLVKGEENEIVVAYVIGQGISPLDAITVAREIDDITQDLFDLNFDTTLVSVNDEEFSANPTDFYLAQNYPNPFNPSTTIKFSLPVTLSGIEGFVVALKIYNALGEEVAVLLDKEFTAGTYEVEWNASNVPSGVYFYQLKTDAFVETKKMIILK
jgi:hypothetical protein